MESALVKKQSEIIDDLYCQLFKRSKAIQLLVDPENGAIIDANLAAQTYYGYSIDELKCLNIKDLNTRPFELIQREMESARQEKRHNFNFQHRLKNGDIRDVAVVSGPFYINEKEFLYSIISDITEQQAARRELQLSEAMLRSFISTTPDGFVTLDPSLLITDVNHAFCKMLGYSAEALLGSSIHSLLSSHESHLIKALLETAKNQNNWSLETTLKRKSGEQAYVLFSAGPIVDGLGIFAFITDISVMKQSEIELKKLSRAVEHTGSSVMITDKEGVIEYVNSSFCAITGYHPSEVIGQNPSIVRTRHTSKKTHQDLWNTILSGNDWRGETYNRTKSGSFYWSFMSISPICDEQGEITHFVSVSEDITEKKMAQSQLEQLALYDPLTGLANRRLFYDRLTQAMASYSRSSTSGLVLVMLDLDKFKQINDTLGHDAGDELLKVVAERLLSCVRKTDTVARIGGDEFILLLLNLHEHTDITQITGQILSAIRAPLEIANQTLEITCSLGVSLFPDDGESPEDVMKNADLALYHAKREGRNNYQFFTEELRKEESLPVV